MKTNFTYLLPVIFLLASNIMLAQAKGPTARFSFNNRKNYDEVGGQNAQLVGTTFTEDRFGNAGSAVYLFGHEGSYINLGRGARLKPETGSIVIWLRVDYEIWAGKGYYVNPVLLTKRSNDDDFYEAYTIYYGLYTKKLDAGCARDSLRQIGVRSADRLELYKWHQAVITYDYNYFSLYLDGKLQHKAVKNFETKFIATDSVLVGASANKKNDRFLAGAVDDISFYDRVLSEEEINGLLHAPDPNKSRLLLNWVMLALCLLTAILIAYLLVRRRLNVLVKRERQSLELANKLLENELRINRALMNPHFIFNSLNTLHNYILKNNVEQASDYLLRFSKLIRRILESNMSDTISLEMEIELIRGYLDVEGLRFNEQIKYKIEVEQGISPSFIIIPIMMVQPFIENSVWHGLANKTGDKIINIAFSMHGSRYIKCVIDDNGTGRKAKALEALEKKSMATAFIQQRLDLLNKIHQLSATLAISDKANGQGTVVTILLPILNK